MEASKEKITFEEIIKKHNLQVKKIDGGYYVDIERMHELGEGVGYTKKVPSEKKRSVKDIEE